MWVDGQSDPSVGVSGRTVTPGTRLTFTGTKRIDVRSGDPSVLLFTLNGRTIDALGNGTGAQTYAFLDTGKVQESSRR
ncbi:MAG: RodZ domain-containing protein [Candidatus Limnocylindrus sp.]